MMDFLDKLRTKPLHVRKRIAFLTTVLLSFVIGSVWWGSWNAENTPLPPQESAMASAVSPWSVVRDTIAGMKESTMATFNETMNQLKEGKLEYANIENPETILTTLGQGAADEKGLLNESSGVGRLTEENLAASEDIHHNELGEERAAEIPAQGALGEAVRTRPRSIEAVAASGMAE